MQHKEGESEPIALGGSSVQCQIGVESVPDNLLVWYLGC